MDDPRSCQSAQGQREGLSILCRNLAAVEVLQKKGASYRNSRLGATALNADHRAYRGGYLNLIKRHWLDWVRLLKSVRSGLPIGHDTTDSPDYRRQFTWAMHHRTMEIAPAIAAQARMGRAKTLLDLGGDEQMTEGCRIRLGQIASHQEGGGGLGGWDSGGINPESTSKSHRPPNTIKRKLKRPLIASAIKDAPTSESFVST